MPDNLTTKRRRTLVALALIIPCVLISVPAMVGYQAERRLSDAFHWVAHTLEVQREIQTTLLLLSDAQAGQRGYVLTSRDGDLAAYRQAVERLSEQTARLRALTADNPVQQAYLRQLDAEVAERLEVMAQTVALQERGEHAEALALVNTGRGARAMAAVRARLGQMEAEEARLLTWREAGLAARAHTSTAILLALVGLSLLFALGMFFMYRRLVRIQGLVTVCAWSRTIEYRGQWLSFEEYLLRRFNLNTSHGLSPAEGEKVMRELEARDGRFSSH